MDRSDAMAEFLDDSSRHIFGISLSDALEKGICVDCKEPAAAKCDTPAGYKEYLISGMCEECFDAMAVQPDDDDEEEQAIIEALNEPAIEVLKRVFSYGHATDTHLDITSYLNELGIPASEYETWGRVSNVIKRREYNGRDSN